MKRTERDEQLLNNIQKNIKENERERENEVKKYEISLIISNEEIEQILNNIEQDVINYFTKEQKSNCETHIVCFGSEINPIFNIETFIHWFKKYNAVIKILSKKEEKEIACNYKYKEIMNLLQRISKLWNETHNTFSMKVFKFGIQINKKE